MIKKLLSHINDTNSKYHLLAMSILITLSLLCIMLWIQVDKLTKIEENLESYKNIMLHYNNNQAISVSKLESDVATLVLADELFEDDIKLNTERIQYNASNITNNKIESDQVSWTSFEYCLNEIWDELKRLNKVK